MDRLEKKRIARVLGASLTAALAAACAGPKIAGLQPEATGAAAPGFRELADIPEKPKIANAADNTETIASLKADKAKTASDAAALEREKVIPPEPVTPQEVPNATPPAPVGTKP